MDLKEAYAVMQKASGIEVGDKVRVLRSFSSSEMGLDSCSVELNSRAKKGTVDTIEKNRIAVKYADIGGWDWFPFFALEIIEKAKQEKMVTIGGKEYSESTIKKALKDYVG